jgi:hypothetical protein
MSWKRFGAVCAIGLATAGALGPARAEPQPSSPAPSAHALELSHRLIHDMRLDVQIDSLLRAMLPGLIDRQSQAIPDFKPEWRQAISEATIEALNDVLPDYLHDAELLYARTFTEDELAQAVAFYESPAGRSFIDKSPSLAPELSKSILAKMSAIQADARDRFCRKSGACSGPAADAKTPS